MSARKVSWRSARRRSKMSRGIFLGLVLLVFLLPLLWTFLASLGITPDDTNSPPVWTWPPTVQNYLEIGVAEPGFLGELEMSLFISVTATLLTTGVALLAAYSLARTPGKRILTEVQAFLILASLPVMAYIIPLSDLMHRLHLYDSFFGLALANTAIYAPLGVYILFGYLRQIPTDLEEAARLDGASLWQTIVRVVTPAAVPGITSNAIILIVLNWNLLLVPLVLTENHVRTIPVAMSDFFTFERDLQWPVAAAVLITSLLPLLILVFAAYRTVNRFSLKPSEEE